MRAIRIPELPRCGWRRIGAAPFWMGVSVNDNCFADLLLERVAVWRPQVALSPLGSPQAPVYEMVSDGVACSLQPVTAASVATVAGRLERTTHVAYARPVDVRAGDLLVERTLADTLAASVDAGDEGITAQQGLGFFAGQWVEIDAGSGGELRMVEAVEGSELTLDVRLSSDHTAGAGVMGVMVYEVMGVRDEGGRGHHLRIDLRGMQA